MKKGRILSGMRPTGPLHIGHYVGALKNWVRLQDEYECFYMVADWHALSSEYADTSRVRRDTLDNVIDWLAAGIDPERSVIFIQSMVPEHAELHVALSMITPLPWLERVPTYKEQRQQIKDKDLGTYGFLGYPLLQAADIALYKGDSVPVGEDQVPHVELTREIVRRFNNMFGPVFPEPKAVLTELPRLPGVDGRKMSKSYGNAVLLSGELKTMEKQVRTMLTDPARVRRTDPGDPDKCPVPEYHKVFSTPEELAHISQGCRSAGIGCIDCKRIVIEHLKELLSSHQERRSELEQDTQRVEQILMEGNQRARETAARTMAEVRQALRFDHLS